MHLHTCVLKALMPITFSSLGPGCNQKYNCTVALFFFFLYQMKAHIFLIIPPNFQLQIRYLLWNGSYSRKCLLSAHTKMYYFVIYFPYSLIPSVKYLFCPREKIKSKLEVQCKCSPSSGQSNIMSATVRASLQTWYPRSSACLSGSVGTMLVLT